MPPSLRAESAPHDLSKHEDARALNSGEAGGSPPDVEERKEQVQARLDEVTMVYTAVVPVIVAAEVSLLGTEVRHTQPAPSSVGLLLNSFTHYYTSTRHLPCS